MGAGEEEFLFWSNSSAIWLVFFIVSRQSVKMMEATIVNSIQIIQLTLLPEGTASQMPQEPPPAALEHKNSVLRNFLNAALP